MEGQRSHWGSSFGFILAATGSAIGLGNLWKFPFITWENNGGAFVLVYLACIMGVGLPIMMAEILIGRKTQRGVVGALREGVGPRWAIVGAWGVLCGFILLSYYSVIAGWSLFYFVRTLGWSFAGFPGSLETRDLFAEQVGNGALQIGLSLLFSLGTISVVYLGIHSGIERLTRTVLPILFGILLLLVFSALRMEGSGEAITFLFRPNFGELETGGLLEALGHSFFTLSLGMGAMITYGSYLDEGQSIVKTSAIIVLLDTAIALIACVIMFSVIFSVAGMEEQIGASPVGMLFIALPELFYSEVPFGVVLGPLFYVLVALAALTSTISLLEVVCSYLIDQHKVARPRATLMAGSTVFLFTILAALSFGSVPGLSSFEIFEGKQGWFSTADHFVSNWMLPTGGLAVTIAAGWFMTREATRGQLLDGTHPAWFRYGVWRFFIRFVAPAAVGAVIVAVFFFGVDFS
jgi:NSS family neurotransmitter:Na+ symporter